MVTTRQLAAHGVAELKGGHTARAVLEELEEAWDQRWRGADEATVEAERVKANAMYAEDLGKRLEADSTFRAEYLTLAAGHICAGVVESAIIDDGALHALAKAAGQDIDNNQPTEPVGVWPDSVALPDEWHPMQFVRTREPSADHEVSIDVLTEAEQILLMWQVRGLEGTASSVRPFRSGPGSTAEGRQGRQTLRQAANGDTRPIRG